MKKLTFVALFLIVGTLANATTVLGPVTNQNNGHDYYLLEKDSWAALEGNAIGLGGHLATIRNIEENYWIYGQFGNYRDAQNELWIGLNDIQGHGEFVWSSNEESLYKNWSSSYPSAGNSQCAFIRNDNAAWSTFDSGGGCVEKRYGVVEVVHNPCPKSPTITKLCNQLDTACVGTSAKSYIIQNNIFNDIDGSQCLKFSGATGDFSITSSVSNKPLDGPPAAYPSIFKGCHWGNCTNNFISGMPKKINNILRANSSWKTVQPSSGIYNVVYDIWINKTSTTLGQPDGAEIMIWLNYTSGIQPLGTLITRRKPISIAGENWNIWLGTNNGIDVVSYVSETGVTSVCNLNLKDFLIDAGRRNYIQSSWYLISIEAGFEIWKNGAGLASKAFNILVE